MLERLNLPCPQSDGFRKPTLKNPYTINWFPDEMCSTFHICDFIGRMPKLKNLYWLETDDFFITTGKSTEETNKASYFCLYQLTTGNNYAFFIKTEIFPTKNTFCKELTQIHTTQYLGFFVTYREAFIMKPGIKNPIVGDEDSSINQQRTSSSFFFDFVNNK